jgi:hypothetical protein
MKQNKNILEKYERLHYLFPNREYSRAKNPNNRKLLFCYWKLSTLKYFTVVQSGLNYFKVTGVPDIIGFLRFLLYYSCD